MDVQCGGFFDGVFEGEDSWHQRRALHRAEGVRVVDTPDGDVYEGLLADCADAVTAGLRGGAPPRLATRLTYRPDDRDLPLDSEVLVAAAPEAAALIPSLAKEEPGRGAGGHGTPRKGRAGRALQAVLATALAVMMLRAASAADFFSSRPSVTAFAETEKPALVEAYGTVPPHSSDDHDRTIQDMERELKSLRRTLTASLRRNRLDSWRHHVSVAGEAAKYAGNIIEGLHNARSKLYVTILSAAPASRLPDTKKVQPAEGGEEKKEEPRHHVEKDDALSGAAGEESDSSSSDSVDMHGEHGAIEEASSEPDAIVKPAIVASLLLWWMAMTMLPAT